VSKGVNLQRRIVSTRLTKLVKAGELEKAPHGYTTEHGGQTP
jgi:hypothetical protein